MHENISLYDLFFPPTIASLLLLIPLPLNLSVTIWPFAQHFSLIISFTQGGFLFFPCTVVHPDHRFQCVLVSWMACLMWIYWLFLLLSPTGVVLPHTCRSPPVYLGEIPKADEIGRAPSCPSTSSCRLQHTTNLHCQYFSQERQAQIPLFLSSTTTELNYSTHRDQELRRESSCCDVHMGSNPVLTIQEHRERLPGENRINCIIIFHCESKIWHVWKKKCWCITAISAHSIQAKATSKFSITNFTLPLISSQRKFSSMISTELLNPIMYFAYK